MCLSFLISSYCLAKLFPKLNPAWVILISLATTLYANNVGMSQVTLCENLLFLLFWCTVLCFLRLCENGKTVWLVLYLLSMIAGYFVHLRCIGIVIAGVLSTGLLLWKKVISRKQVLFVILIPACLVGGMVFKDYFQSILYASELSSGANDFSGQVGKLQSMLSWQGIKNLIKGFTGKVWYLASATLLLVPWFGFICVKQIRPKTLFSKEERDVNGLVLSFLALCLLAELGISTIFMIEPSRIDTLIYGRYSEFVLGPILGIALCWLVSLEEYPWKESFFMGAFYVFLTMLAHFFFIRLVYSDALSGIVYTNIAGIFRYVWGRDVSIFEVSIKCLAIMQVIYLLFVMKKQAKWPLKRLRRGAQFLAICACAGIWLWNGAGYAQKEVAQYQAEQADVDIAEIIELADQDGDSPIYYIYAPEDTNYVKNRIFVVQLSLKDRAIEIVDNDTFSTESYEPDAFYLVNKSASVVEEVKAEYNWVYTGSRLELLVSDQYPNAQRLYDIASEIKAMS